MVPSHVDQVCVSWGENLRIHGQPASHLDRYPFVIGTVLPTLRLSQRLDDGDSVVSTKSPARKRSLWLIPSAAEPSLQLQVTWRA